MKQKRASKDLAQKSFNYDKIRNIDGSHPFQAAVPDGHIPYQARQRGHAKPIYFNFGLAKQLGLIAPDHPNQLLPDLQKALLEAFDLIIINEYDIETKKRFPPNEVKANSYMATRYLQLQHPDKRGLNSGDGRSIWNGTVSHLGQTWDVSSCGTGATRLSPATSINGRFYQSGDPTVSYGCGYAVLDEGLVDVVFSEHLNRNGIASERVLCVLEYRGGFSVTVRVGQNLLRPSHFFIHLKQANRTALRQVLDYYIGRQVSNGYWQIGHKNRYDYFLDRMTETFAEISAVFEAHYIFCWLDWDGDNILADGGIIDFGSVRQMGLFFHAYRFDDDDRWSTTIKEQRLKARYTVQSFAQVIDFVKTGTKRGIAQFKHHRVLKEFDRIYERKKRQLFLWRLGFTSDLAARIETKHFKICRRLMRSFDYLERKKTNRGLVEVADGINCDMAFNMRKAIAGLIEHWLSDQTLLSTEDFLAIALAENVEAKDISLSRSLQVNIRAFQNDYWTLIKKAIQLQSTPTRLFLLEHARRVQLINRTDRLTGDSICVIVDELLKRRKDLTVGDLYRTIRLFVEQQSYTPLSQGESEIEELGDEHLDKLLQKLTSIVRHYSEGL